MSARSIRNRVGRLIVATIFMTSTIGLVGVSPAAAEWDYFNIEKITSWDPAVPDGNNGYSENPSVSSDGRYVAFQSRASNLVAGDTNDQSDIFVVDRTTSTITCVSVATDGTQANSSSYNASISADGNTVVFESDADNLVAGDTNSARDIFVHDIGAGTTALVSVATDGTQANSNSYNASISADGNVVAWWSYSNNLVVGDTNNNTDVFVRNLGEGTTTRVSVATDGTQSNSGSYAPAISGDGSVVAFESYANNLVAGDTNGNTDVFVHDIGAGTTALVSVATDGTQANGSSYSAAVSGDGNVIAWRSYSNNLVVGDTNINNDIFVRNLDTGTTTRVSVATDGTQSNSDSYAPAISGDGNTVVFESYANNLVAGDANGTSDIFVHDIGAGTTALVSVATDGTQANNGGNGAAVSADGNVVAFASYANNLVVGDTNNYTDVFVRDIGGGTTTRVSVATDGTQANSSSYNASISADGSIVTFDSSANSLVAGDTNGSTDVFVHDIGAGTTALVSVATDGTQANNGGNGAAVSADGNVVAFASYASNLVAGDTNGSTDVFVRDIGAGTTEAAAVGFFDGEPFDDSYFGRVSGNGRYVAYHSEASNLVPNDTNNDNDVFRYDRYTGETIIVSVATDGTRGDGCSTKPAISFDGRYIVFQSDSTNLVADDANGTSADIYVHDVDAGTTVLVSKTTDGEQGDDCSSWPTISADGSTVAFRSEASNLSGDVSVDYTDIYVHDMASHETTLASVSPDGTEGGNEDSHWPSLSADGTYLAFRSDADNLVDADENGNADIFVRNMASQETTLVSISSDGEQGDDCSRWPSISADGSLVAFQSGSTNFSEAADGDGYSDGDIFVHDMASGETTCASLALDGGEADDCSSNPAISGDGKFVVFQSEASNLVENDTNDEDDIFIRDLTTGEIKRLSVATDGTEGDCCADKPSISHDGSLVAFSSDALGLIAGTTLTSSVDQIYVVDLGAGPYSPIPVAGTDRFETAVATSLNAFADGASTVVIATGRNWPDALGGAALAGALEGPVLLVDTNAVPAVIADEIDRLGATDAIILGGTNAVSAGVQTTLEGMLTNVTRVGGADRYETAEMVAALTVTTLGSEFSGTCFVATGNNFADALSASPLASAAGLPVYLSGADSVSPATLAAMQTAGVTDVILLGGEAAVTPETAITVLGAGMTATRIDGATRYETAAKVAEYGVNTFGLRWDGVAITTGQNFPDALTGGAAQGFTGSVMLLTASSTLSPEAGTCLTTHKNQIGDVVYLGGLNAVSQTVRDSVASIIE